VVLLSNKVLKANRSVVDGFVNGSGDGNDELTGTCIRQGANIETPQSDVGAENDDTVYDNESMSVIRLNKDMVLCLKLIDTMLTLVCLIRSDNFRKRELIN